MDLGRSWTFWEWQLLSIRITGFFPRIFPSAMQENQKYLSVSAKYRSWFQKEKRMMSQRKDYHIYSCPGCGQKIRIPRGGFKKVEIECPKCHTKFIKRR